jgi:spore coat polysaccharide biosynthesis protein SpsF
MTRSCGIITQARYGSTRLPAKILKPLGDRTVLEHHLDRLRASGLPVYVATTVEPESSQIVEICREREVGFFKGSIDDVLDRFFQCAKHFGLDVIVRVTSDCPLIDGQVIAEALKEYRKHDGTDVYLSNGQNRTFPRGFDFEIFSFQMLEEAHRNAIEIHEREHVTPYMYSGGISNVRIEHFMREIDSSKYRVTLDTDKDYELIKVLFDEYDCAAKSCDEIIAILERNTQLHEMNRHVEQKKLGE